MDVYSQSSHGRLLQLTSNLNLNGLLSKKAGKNRNGLERRTYARVKKCTQIIFIILIENKARSSFVMAKICFKRKK